MDRLFGGFQANLGRPPTKPCWSLVVPTVAVACAVLHGRSDRKRRAPAKRRRLLPLYASIALKAAAAFVLGLACCVVAWLWYAATARRRDDATSEARAREVAFYCGFVFVPGERRHGWDGSALAEGIGGSEQCAIRLARALARTGRRVVVYGGRRRTATFVDGVIYEPARRFDPRAACGRRADIPETGRGDAAAARRG